MTSKVKTLLKVGLPLVIVIQLISLLFYWRRWVKIKHSHVKQLVIILCVNK